jgi:hypothetical protein
MVQIYFLGPADIMSEANETELTPEEQRMRAELLQVTSELEYEKNHTSAAISSWSNRELLCSGPV